MAITFPIELPSSVSLLYQSGMPYDFVLSWANSYRSLEFCNIPQQADVLPVGALLNQDAEPALAPGDIRYLLCYPVDPRYGTERATVVARDAEVNDAYLAYGALDRGQVNTHLRDNLNIIVREAILPNVVNAGFHGQGQGAGWTMFHGATVTRGEGAVGAPTYKGAVAQEMPDPSPGVQSVVGDHMEPTPSPEQRQAEIQRRARPAPGQARNGNNRRGPQRT